MMLTDSDEFDDSCDGLMSEIIDDSLELENIEIEVRDDISLEEGN